MAELCEAIDTISPDEMGEVLVAAARREGGIALWMRTDSCILRAQASVEGALPLPVSGAMSR